MADVNDALAANRDAVLDLVAAAERSAATWKTPRAPGKWSPSQVSLPESSFWLNRLHLVRSIAFGH